MGNNAIGAPAVMLAAWPGILPDLPKLARRVAGLYAANNRCNHPFTQINGKRSGHRMLAPYPASTLNHKPRSNGIPTDSANT
jgi:hypothetical protein